MYHSGVQRGTGDGQFEDHGEMQLTLKATCMLRIWATVGSRNFPLRIISRSICAIGIGSGQVMWPHGLAVDETGNLYVADAGNYRIQKFDSTDYS